MPASAGTRAISACLETRSASRPVKLLAKYELERFTQGEKTLRSYHCHARLDAHRREQSPVRSFVGLLSAFVLCGLLNAHAAQMGQPAPPPNTLAPARVPTVGTISQPISLQAGSGVLLQLPQAAATVMSAEPSIARVQPAWPTSLFLMGVAPGRTTVIETTDAGQAIAQYDVTVTPGTGGQTLSRCGEW